MASQVAFHANRRDAEGIWERGPLLQGGGGHAQAAAAGAPEYIPTVDPELHFLTYALPADQLTPAPLPKQ